MALTGANELKRKMMIKVDGEPYTVVEVFFASPSARGATTMVRTRLRHLLTGAVLEKSFRSSEKFEEPDVQYAPASFMYSDSDGFHFMDDETFEQFMLPAGQVGDDRGYLTDGLVVQVLKYNGEAAALELPQFVELSVAETEPGIKGDTAGGGRDTKPATLETGLQVRVPLFIKEGERVRVNTQTGEVAGRA
ncbi:MAG TPA: elongation factor P [Pyrinomonadaceae bacterium]|nr:elongation factor P [Pyrinomonadaceae bacterium]